MLFCAYNSLHHYKIYKVEARIWCILNCLPNNQLFRVFRSPSTVPISFRKLSMAVCAAQYSHNYINGNQKVLWKLAFSLLPTIYFTDKIYWLFLLCSFFLTLFKFILFVAVKLQQRMWNDTNSHRHNKQARSTKQKAFFLLFSSMHLIQLVSYFHGYSNQL